VGRLGYHSRPVSANAKGSWEYSHAQNGSFEREGAVQNGSFEREGAVQNGSFEREGAAENEALSLVERGGEELT
jgi:hypothetical protein